MGSHAVFFVLPLFSNFYKSTSILSQTFRTSGFSANSLQSCSHFPFKTVFWDSCSLVFFLPLKIPNNCFLQILWLWWFRSSFVLSASAALLGFRKADCQSLLHNSCVSTWNFLSNTPIQIWGMSLFSHVTHELSVMQHLWGKHTVSSCSLDSAQKVLQWVEESVIFKEHANSV